MIEDCTLSAHSLFFFGQAEGFTFFAVANLPFTRSKLPKREQVVKCLNFKILKVLAAGHTEDLT